MDRIADGGIALLLALLLVLLPGARGAVGVDETAALGLVSLALLLLFLLPRILGSAGRPPALRPHLWLLIALGGILALAAVQLVPLPWAWIRSVRPAQARLLDALGAGGGATTLSLHPFHTRLGLIQVGAAGIAFLIGALWVRRLSQVHLLLVGYVAVASVVALFGILQALSGDTIAAFQSSYPSEGRARGPFVNPNHFAGYLEMAAPIAISYLFFTGRILRSRRRGSVPGGGGDAARPGRIVFLLLAAALLCAGVIRSLSLMGIFSLAASIILLGLLLGVRRRRRLVGFGAVLLAVAGLVLLLGPGAAWSRLSLLADPSGPAKRTVAWGMTLGAIRDYPVFGTGLRTFQDVSPLYQPEAVPGWYAESHNDYLNLASDLGLVGCAFICAAGILWWRRARDGWRAIDAPRRPILAGALAGIVAMLLHEAVDFNLQIPANSFQFGLLAGLALSIPRLSAPGIARKGTAGAVRGRAILLSSLGVVAALLVAFSEVRLLLADRLYGGGGEEELLRAEEIDPCRSDIPFRRGRILEDGGRNEEARLAFLEAVRCNPLSGEAHYKAGVQEERSGRREEARVRFDRALAVAPNNPDILYKVASYRLDWWMSAPEGERDTGEVRKILRIFRRAGLLSPGHAESALSRLGDRFAKVQVLRMARPRTAWGHRSLGRVLEAKGLWREASEEYERWARLAAGRERPRALLALGVTLLRSGDGDGAREALLRGARGSPAADRYIEALFERLRAAGIVEEGIPVWRAYAREAPIHAEAMRLLEGRALRLSGRPEEARPILTGLQDGPLAADASFELYRIDREVAPIAAEMHIRRAIRLRPRDPLLRHHLALDLERRGELVEALSEAREAAHLRPEEPSYRDHVDRLNRRLAAGD